MFSHVQDLMQWRMALMLEGRHQDLAQEYLYPLPVYLRGRQQVLRTAEEMVGALKRLSGITLARGITRIETRVTAIELPREGRFRVWVSHRDFSAGGEMLGGGLYVHYCRLTDAGIKTEMSDFPDCRADWAQREGQRIPA